MTVLVTTHLMEEAEHCDRLAILSAGKLVAHGSPAELKAQIGGDIVQFETRGAEAAGELAAGIAQRFAASPNAVSPNVVGNTVRIEREQGHRFLTEVVEAFPGAIESVSVAKPSLEDVFIQRTGHRFWMDDPAATKPAKERH